MSDGFTIQQFSPEFYPALRAFARAVHVPLLLDRRFVEHYYLGQQWSRLFLAFGSASSDCVGAIGVDLLSFSVGRTPLNVAFATNFYSLQPGVGGMLWLKWMKTAPLGLVFGGSQDAHRILRSRNFQYYPGVNLYRLNARYEGYPEDPTAKRILKSAVRPWFRSQLSSYASKAFLKRFRNLTVAEQPQLSPEMLIEGGPFSVRLNPSLDYLAWRYNPRLAHVRYRIFQFFRSGETCGYCILNDGPQEIVVSHSDGVDPELVAAGILKAIFLLGEDGRKNRKAVLACSHPLMQPLFVECGFRLTQENYPFAAGALRSPRSLGDTRGWLINFGIGDNDLRHHMFRAAENAAPD